MSALDKNYQEAFVKLIYFVLKARGRTCENDKRGIQPKSRNESMEGFWFDASQTSLKRHGSH